MPRDEITTKALMVAAAGLLPVPFLDTWLQSQLQRDMVHLIGRRAGQRLAHAQVVHLTEQNDSLLLGCLQGALIWPIRRIFRKVVYILTVKDAVDAAATTYVRGELIRRAFAHGLLPHHTGAVKTAIKDVLTTHTRSPLWGHRTNGPRSFAADPHDPLLVRALAAAAHRGGAAEALAAFEAWATEHSPPPKDSEDSEDSEDTEDSADSEPNEDTDPNEHPASNAPLSEV